MMSGKPLRDAAPIIGLLCIMGALALIVAKCTACSSAPSRLPEAADLGSYTLELQQCRDQGKASRSYEVYEACARAADRRHGINLDGGPP